MTLRLRLHGAKTQAAGLSLLLCCLCVAACGERASQEEPVPSSTPEHDYASTLSRLPVDFTSHVTMSGSGSVSGVVEDGQLLIDGAFRDVESSVVAAHLHQARPGLRGLPVAPLEVDLVGDGTVGTVAGVIGLSPDLLRALEMGELYVQIHSEDNPDGVLRGWLLPPR